MCVCARACVCLYTGVPDATRRRAKYTTQHSDGTCNIQRTTRYATHNLHGTGTARRTPYRQMPPTHRRTANPTPSGACHAFGKPRPGAAVPEVGLPRYSESQLPATRDAKPTHRHRRSGAFGPSPARPERALHSVLMVLWVLKRCWWDAPLRWRVCHRRWYLPQDSRSGIGCTGWACRGT